MFSKLYIIIAAMFAMLFAGQTSAFTYGPLLPTYLYNHRPNLPTSLGGVILKFGEPVGPAVAGYHNSNVTTAGLNIVAITVTTLRGTPVTRLRLNRVYNLTLTSSPNGIVDINLPLDGILMWGENHKQVKVGHFIKFPTVFSYYPYAVKKQGIVHNTVLSETGTIGGILYKTPKTLKGNIIRLGGLACTDSQFGFWGKNFTVLKGWKSSSSGMMPDNNTTVASAGSSSAASTNGMPTMMPTMVSASASSMAAAAVTPAGASSMSSMTAPASASSPAMPSGSNLSHF